MTDYLVYWRAETADAALATGGLLKHAASNQFGGVLPADTLWVVATSPQGHLMLLGRIEVGEVVSQATAEQVLGPDQWKADYHVLARAGTAEPYGSFDLSRIVRELRFQSERDRLAVGVGGVVNGQQLQSMRVLTPGSRDLLNSVLLREGGRVDGSPTRTAGPIVLTQNEKIVGDLFAWEDIEGVQYHYPNGYRNLVVPGARFVYYRGVNRTDGSRGQAEYFGTGIIDDVWPDPAQPDDTPAGKRNWYCSIADYVTFATPVPARADGEYVEALGRASPLQGNHFRTAVRRLTDEAYEAIMGGAGLAPEAPVLRKAGAALAPVESLPLPAQSALEDVVRTATRQTSRRSGLHSSARAREPKVIGDRAEEFVVRLLRERHGVGAVRWVAADGDTPGWDIEYDDAERGVIRVEVKGTTNTRFPSINLTRNEWEAAQAHGAAFELWLVTRALSSQPGYGVLTDVAAAVEDGSVSIEAAVWEMRF